MLTIYKHVFVVKIIFASPFQKRWEIYFQFNSNVYAIVYYLIYVYSCTQDWDLSSLTSH